MIDRIIKELERHNLELNKRGMKVLKENEASLSRYAENYEMSVSANLGGLCTLKFSKDGHVICTYMLYSAVR